MWSFYVWKMKFSKFIIGFPKKKKFILFASANICLFVPETKQVFLKRKFKGKFWVLRVMLYVFC